MDANQLISPSNTYLRLDNDMYGYDDIPFENFNWTGKWKIVIKNGASYLWLERRMMLFGVIPTFRGWEGEDEFRYDKYEAYTNECEV